VDTYALTVLVEQQQFARPRPARHCQALTRARPLGQLDTAGAQYPPGVVGHYESFFTASAGASAAILGLLVVAVSVVNADDADPKTRELRTVLAGSAFVVLVDIFFVSIVTLTGGPVVFALSSFAMATIGLVATRQLIPRAKRAGNFTASFRNRRLNLAFASISVVGYSAQLGLAIALLASEHSAALQRSLVLVLVVFYASALGRAWEVTGITRRG
jgi:hypothetical protein